LGRLLKRGKKSGDIKLGGQGKGAGVSRLNSEREKNSKDIEGKGTHATNLLDRRAPAKRKRYSLERTSSSLEAHNLYGGFGQESVTIHLEGETVSICRALSQSKGDSPSRGAELNQFERRRDSSDADDADSAGRAPGGKRYAFFSEKTILE